MSWFFSKSSSESYNSFPVTTPLQQQRLNQIKSLAQHLNVIEVQRDIEYRVTFPVAGNTINFNILLPPNFPNEKPIVTVSPKLKHPWVNEQMIIVDAPGLKTFYVHSDLGKVVKQIIKEFKTNPPQFSNSFSPSTNLTSPSGFNQQLINPVKEVKLNVIPDRPPHYSENHKVIASNKCTYDEAIQPCDIQTDINNVMEKLKHFSKIELENVCNNEDLLLEYIEEMKTITDLQVQRTKLLEENENIAVMNLKFETQIEDKQVDLKELIEESDDLYHKFQNKSQKQTELLQMYEIGHISTNLRISILEVEEDSENIADQFLSGSLNLESFLEKFLDKRKLTHIRRAKEEMLKSVFV
ncbi:vacuolar protein sorting-associated protein 37A isoform X1 [Hydra vulgaris]|uniref:vacuolar protein sorting-associated protein 37A isoform X1 n=1 Tax=Hydra vulgaris TaxID=6087 RepID=UPI001F5E4F27|nr:vacuolar protein sorting-associated protein 37A [Hydra vulgaris]